MIGTKIRLFQNMKTKSSLSLPPDHNSLRQELYVYITKFIIEYHHILTELDPYEWNHGVLNYRPTHHAADLKMWAPIIFSSGWRNN